MWKEQNKFHPHQLVPLLIPLLPFPKQQRFFFSSSHCLPYHPDATYLVLIDSGNDAGHPRSIVPLVLPLLLYARQQRFCPLLVKLFGLPPNATYSKAVIIQFVFLYFFRLYHRGYLAQGGRNMLCPPRAVRLVYLMLPTPKRQQYFSFSFVSSTCPAAATLCKAADISFVLLKRFCFDTNATYSTAAVMFFIFVYSVRICHNCYLLQGGKNIVCLQRTSRPVLALLPSPRRQ